jgi:hypothetical protein
MAQTMCIASFEPFLVVPLSCYTPHHQVAVVSVVVAVIMVIVVEVVVVMGQ